MWLKIIISYNNISFAIANSEYICYLGRETALFDMFNKTNIYFSNTFTPQGQHIVYHSHHLISMKFIYRNILFIFSFFAYKHHDFFLFKKYTGT